MLATENGLIPNGNFTMIIISSFKKIKILSEEFKKDKSINMLKICKFFNVFRTSEMYLRRSKE